MCGIVAYIGEQNSVPYLIEGLKKLEYRGYDSAGIAYIDADGSLKYKKEVGKLENLEKLIDNDEGLLGIGHTRWATHGSPSVKNSHPHLSQDGKIAVVHNGIIENFLELKEKLIKEHGITFVSDTDTELVAHLIQIKQSEGHDLINSLHESVKELKGAYALAVISQDDPSRIVSVRKDSPLIIGFSEDGNFLASDVPAVIKHTREVYYMENDQYAVISKDDVQVYDEDLNSIEFEKSHVDWDVESAEKDGYEHFTLKEIFEQDKALNDTLIRRIDGDDINIEFSLSKEYLENIDKIYIVACGTAYHAGLLGKHMIEELADIPVEVDIASEFRYNKSFINEKSLFIAISQSGETLDTLHALRKAKEQGAKIMSILNVVGSSIARESDEVFYTWAGPEIGVASTKAYTTQAASLALIALKMAKLTGKIDDEKYTSYLNELKRIPELVKIALEGEEKVKEFAQNEFEKEVIFFVGRGLDYYSALEASLKLKEISYINSFAIQAGELKHGTIALVEEGTLGIVFMTQDDLESKVISNIKEIKARGAKVLVICKEGHKTVEDVSDYVIYVPEVKDDLMGILSIIPAQLFAYHVSNFRGNNVDMPRNLAKSVTVE